MMEIFTNAELLTPELLTPELLTPEPGFLKFRLRDINGKLRLTPTVPFAPESNIRQLQHKKNAQIYQCDNDHLAWIGAGKLLLSSQQDITTAELAVEIAQLQLTAAKLKLDRQKKYQIECEEKMVVSHRIRSEIEQKLKTETLKYTVKEYRIDECATRKNEKKNAKTRIDFKKMLKLPEVMIDYIESFLSYDTRIHLLETKFNPYKLLHRLNKYTINHLIKQICLSPEFFKNLSVEEAKKQFFNYDIPKPWEQYCPYWFCFSHIDSKNTAISMIYKLKKINPQAAYKWIKQISMLINPTKIYKSHSDCYM